MLYQSGLSTLQQQLWFKFVFCLLLENRWLIASAVQKHMGHSFLASFLHALSSIVTVFLSSYYRVNHCLALHPAVHSRFPAVLIFSILLGESLQESPLQCLFLIFCGFRISCSANSNGILSFALFTLLSCYLSNATFNWSCLVYYSSCGYSLRHLLWLSSLNAAFETPLSLMLSFFF